MVKLPILLAVALTSRELNVLIQMTFKSNSESKKVSLSSKETCTTKTNLEIHQDNKSYFQTAYSTDPSPSCQPLVQTKRISKKIVWLPTLCLLVLALTMTFYRPRSRIPWNSKWSGRIASTMTTIRTLEVAQSSSLSLLCSALCASHLLATSSQARCSNLSLRW